MVNITQGGPENSTISLSMIVLQSPELKTINLVLSSLSFAYFPDYGMIMVGTVIATLPTLVIFFAMQKQFVTHDQVEAMTLADKIVVLRKGNIGQVGSPPELYNRPANEFVAGFIGSPKMNLLDATVHKGGSGVITVELMNGPGSHKVLASAINGRFLASKLPIAFMPPIVVRLRQENIVISEGGAIGLYRVYKPSDSVRPSSMAWWSRCSLFHHDHGGQGARWPEAPPFEIHNNNTQQLIYTDLDRY